MKPLKCKTSSPEIFKFSKTVKIKKKLINFGLNVKSSLNFDQKFKFLKPLESKVQWNTYSWRLCQISTHPSQKLRSTSSC